MTAKGFVELMSAYNYSVYSGVYSDRFVEAISETSAIGFSAGLKVGGVRSVLLINDVYDFLKLSKTISDEYEIGLFGILSEDQYDLSTFRKHNIKVITKSKNFKTTLKKRLKEVDNKEICVFVSEKGDLND